MSVYSIIGQYPRTGHGMSGIIFNDAESLDLVETAINEHHTVNIATDFDGTLSKKHPNGMRGTIWEALTSLMDDDMLALHQNSYETFHEIELAGKLHEPYYDKTAGAYTHMTNDEAWQRAGLSSTIGINQATAIQAVRKFITLKPGTVGLLELCAHAGITVDVKSTAIASLIKARLQTRRLPPEAMPHIYANEMELNEAGEFAGFNPDTMVRSTNKASFGLQPASQYGAKHLTIVTGDSLHDQSLSNSLPDRTLALRADGGLGQIRKLGGEAKVTNFIHESFAAGFNGVVIDETMFAVKALLQQFTPHLRDAA